ncbi:MAG: hypothetical protein WD673_12090 [Alphaproteobacteria bacterium]
MKTAVFVTHAAPGIGGGHLARCLALAEELSSAGWRCRIAAPDLSFGVLPVAPGFERIVLPDGPLPDPARLAASLASSDLVVFDRYDVSAAHEDASPCRVLTIADGATREMRAEVVLDATPGREATAYAGLVPAGTTLLLGSSYAPLRSAFATLRPAALGRRAATGPPRRLVVGFGASAGPILEDAMAAIRSAAPDASVVAIQGKSPAEVARLYAEADLAVGSAGVSALERCAVGLPSIAFAVADNQTDQLAGLDRAGAVRALGPWDAGAEARLRAALAELRGDDDRRRTMAERAAAIVDGLGAARVARVVAAP